MQLASSGTNPAENLKFLSRIDSCFCLLLQTLCETRRYPARIKMVPQVLHPTMEHRSISTPVLRIFAQRSPFQPDGKADLLTEVFDSTPCFISLSQNLGRRANAVD
jgi:hypothetical protein